MAAQLADIMMIVTLLSLMVGGVLLGFAMSTKPTNDRSGRVFEAKQLPEEYTRGISRV